MKFRTFAAAAVLVVAFAGSGYAACDGKVAAYQQFAPPTQDQGAGANSAAYQQFAPPTQDQGAGTNSAAYQQFAPPTQDQGAGANSVACR